MPNDAISIWGEEYEEFIAKWERARDVLSGEDSVKARGERYLPKLEGQTKAEFDSYRERSQFFGATARTSDGLQGMIFRKPPTLKMASADLEKAFSEDIDLAGTPIQDYARNVTSDVIGLGRAVSLVDYDDDEARAYVTGYKAEDVFRWKVERVNGRMVLTEVAIREHGQKAITVDPRVGEEARVEQIRLLRMDLGPFTADAPTGNLAYRVEIWQLLPKNKRSKESDWVKVADTTPTRTGKPLTFIPLVFHGPKGSSPTPTKGPMDDIIAVNLHHYRLSADYNHGLHYTALPTAWVAGFDPKTSLRIGSGAAWVSDNPQANAGFLEFTGQGLGAIEKALEKDERYMAVLGSRMLEEQKKDAETEETVRLRQSGEGSVLASISRSVSLGLTKVLRIATWWMGTEESPEAFTDEQVSYALNTDFISARMDSAELLALVDAWSRRAISRETLHWNLAQGEVLPPGVTAEEEQELIENEAPVMGLLMDAPMSDEEKDLEEQRIKEDGKAKAAGAAAAGAAKGAKK